MLHKLHLKSSKCFLKKGLSSNPSPTAMKQKQLVGGGMNAEELHVFMYSNACIHSVYVVVLHTCKLRIQSRKIDLKIENALDHTTKHFPFVVDWCYHLSHELYFSAL